MILNKQFQRPIGSQEPANDPKYHWLLLMRICYFNFLIVLYIICLFIRLYNLIYISLRVLGKFSWFLQGLELWNPFSCFRAVCIFIVSSFLRFFCAQDSCNNWFVFIFETRKIIQNSVQMLEPYRTCYICSGSTYFRVRNTSSQFKRCIICRLLGQ